MFGFFRTKKDDAQSSPGIRKYETLKSDLKNKELCEALLQIASGDNQVPLSLALEARNSVANINYIANLTGISGNELIAAIINKSHDTEIRKIILDKEKDTQETFNEGTGWTQELINWAEENNLPELQQHATTAYRQTGFPRNAQDLVSLECIHLPNCGLKSIPQEISNLKGVQAVCLDDNQLEYLPLGLCELERLARLDLDNNRITRLPTEIGALKNLRILSMRNNPIEDFPSEMLNLHSLQKFDIKGAELHLGSENCPLSENGLTVYWTLKDIIKGP